MSDYDFPFPFLRAWICNGILQVMSTKLIMLIAFVSISILVLKYVILIL